MYGVVNNALAQYTQMTEADMDLVLEGLWKGTQNRQARGRGLQQPLFLLHVEYADPFFRIGYLDEGVTLIPEAEEWRKPVKPSKIDEIQLDVQNLAATLAKYQDKIARCRVWVNPSLQIIGDLPAEVGKPW